MAVNKYSMKKLFLAPLFILLFASCAKEQNDAPPYGSVSINLSYIGELKVPHKRWDAALDSFVIDTFVNVRPLVFDTLIFSKNFGEMFSISKLEYYISHITFWRGGNMVYSSREIHYIDARNPNSTIRLNFVPTGIYDKVAYFIGITDDMNVHDSLPSTQENVNMQWPSSMGGGYHFMKMEGYWKNPTSHKLQSGFAIHLGSNGYAVYGESSPVNFQVQSGYVNTLNFRMNINQWWRSPNDYSIDLNGNYTMGDTSKMRMIRDNGMNVFDIYP